MTTIQDLILPSVISNCCNAKVLMPDLCLECHDHCEAIDPEESELTLDAMDRF